MQLFTSPIRTRIVSIGALCVAVVLAVVLPHGQALTSGQAATSSYPFTLCPAALGGSEKIGLPATRVQVRSINGKSQSTKPAPSMILNSYQYASSYPLYIQGNPGIPVAWNSSASSALTGVSCNSGALSQWLIGGTAGLSSQDLLEIINSGLASAIVAIYPYTTKGPLAPISMTVKANSDAQIPVSTLAPGENSLAVEVVSSSARIASYLLDHRKAGLSELGSSFVPEQDQAQTTIYLGGLTNGAYSGSKANTQLVRLLVPGTQDANISATIYTSNGAVTPVGLSSLSVPHQKVLDVALPTAALPSPFGIMLTSDQPILASALTSSVTTHAIAWASALTPVATSAGSVTRINFAGAQPKLVFMGANISVRVNWQPSIGKGASAVITGDQIAAWSAPSATTTVTLTQLNPGAGQNLYVGAIMGDSSGGALSYLALPSATTQSGSAQSASDIRALIPKAR